MRTWLTAALLCSASAYATTEDPYLWLEQVSSDEAMSWVTAQNSQAEKALTAYPKYQQFFDATLEVMDSTDKIDYPSRVGNYLYNFWRDAKHTKGLYRRTTAESYASGKPEWQTVLDIDALAEAEGENWVFKGMSCLYPAYQHCLVYLSRGGADATVVREFSKASMSFVENGFFLPEAKSQVAWRDENSLFVATDFGEGTLTDSGYPRITKIWQRGAELAEAPTIYEGNKSSVAASVFRIFTADKHYDVVYESLNFYSNQAWLLADGQRLAIPKPDSATLGGIFADSLLLNLRQDWPEYGFKQGAVVAMSIAAIKDGKTEVSLVLTPTANLSIERIARTKDYLLVSVLEDVKTKVLRLEQRDGKWLSKEIPLAENASIGIFNTDEADNTFHYTVTGFLTPASLYSADSKTLEKQLLRQAPSWFDASKFKVEQHKAKSKDGTLVPYFIVMPKTMKYNGKNPTLLYGYGGFEVSLTPSYSAGVGRNWLAEGGVYVLANIRGGGEYGPAWHQAALQKNRMKSYEDFFAIAEDLIARKITSPQHLGIKGGSNGGLLTGAALVLRPELFGAVISQVPLLDMRRYHQLLAGASWMAEYGDPDQDEFWQVIKTYSPYHNLHKDKKYPKAFFYTSTRDDRVHPAHARKMVARMLEQGHPVYYYENIEGGHAGASDNRQSARMAALEYSYLWQQLK